MAETCQTKAKGQICPACGCTITGGGYEKGGVKYCCEPCATDNACNCGCCKPVTGEKEESKTGTGSK
jgi:hypothetical protein